MKVVYKKTIIEQFEEALVFARRHSKLIEKFVITEDEFKNLGNDCIYLFTVVKDGSVILYYNSILVEVKND